MLSHFPTRGGTVLDLEFLTDYKGRRVAAFGYRAGYAGAALAVEAWAWQLTHSSKEPMPGVKSYANQDLLLRTSGQKWQMVKINQDISRECS